MDSSGINSTGNIYLYAGQGVGPFTLEKTKESFSRYLGEHSARLIPLEDPSYFTLNKIADASAVIFPGGSAYTYRAYLEESGVSCIKTLVNRGTSYIGFCAGAYLAAPLQYKTNERCDTFDFNLNLTSRCAYGPTYPTQYPLSLMTVQIIPVALFGEQTPFHVWWNGGGYLPHNATDVPLALYHEGPHTGKYAVSVVKERKGTVVLSALHPEVIVTPDEMKTKFSYIKNADLYLESACQQRKLFNQICEYAGIQPGPGNEAISDS